MDGQTQTVLNHVGDPVEDTVILDDHEYDSLLSAEDDAYIGVYLSVVYILAFTLNTLDIYTCLRNWNILITSDMYIISLASSDMLITILGYHFPIMSSFSHGWAYGKSGCAIYGFLSMYFAVVSISILAIMGVVRYIRICHPHINVTGKYFMVVTVSFPYIYALVWSLMPLTGMAAYALESYRTSCTLRWGGGNSTFITLMVVCCILTPLLFIIFAYGHILRKFRDSNRNIRGQNKKSFRVARKQKFLIQIVFMMCFGFLLSWMPYAVVSLWSAYHGDGSIPMKVRVISVLLARSSTVTNPIIYFLMSKKFRPLLLDCLSRVNCCRGQDFSLVKKSNRPLHWNAVTGSRNVRASHLASPSEVTLAGTKLVSNKMGRNSMASIEL